MKQPKRHGRISRVRKRPLALDEQKIVMLIGQDKLLHGAIHKIAHDAIDRAAIAFDHNARLARGDELRIVARFLRPIASSTEASILPTEQSCPTV